MGRFFNDRFFNRKPKTTVSSNGTVTVPHEDLVEGLEKARAARAPHNPPQQVILAADTRERTASELIAAAGNDVPALMGAMQLIAQRFEASVQATHQLNRGLAEFREKVSNQLLGELKLLRYNLGDKLTHTTTNLDSMVNQLDKVLWGAMRAAGTSDAQIREYRTEHGMEPEAPTGPELEAHVAEVEALRQQNQELVMQNRRLLARLEGVHQFGQAEGWTFKQDCPCSQCRDEYERIAAMQAEATRVP